MEGFTRPIPQPADLLAAIQGVDRGRRVRTGVAAVAPPPRPPGPAGLVRVLRRRDVRLGKKGGAKVGPTRRGKGTKVMAVVDGNGVPLGVDTAPANRNEVVLIEPLLGKLVLPRRKPRRLVYDKAADSDQLRARLRARGIDQVTPHRRGRKRPAIQDGRKLRRYRRRWKVERSFAWLHNFRRIVTRWEYHAHLYHGFVQLASLFTILKRL